MNKNSDFKFNSCVLCADVYSIVLVLQCADSIVLVLQCAAGIVLVLLCTDGIVLVLQ